MIKVAKVFAGQTLSFETGRLARQAHGAVLVQHADTVVLVAVVVNSNVDPNKDFFPLTVDYREKTYAAGKIPGGFFKREGRPRDKEILSARLIDRPIRPLFPDGFFNEVQVLATVLSSDQEHQADVLAITGASAALSISKIPFLGPIAGVRVGMIDGQFVINPTFSQIDKSTLELVVAGTADSILMIEGSAKEVSEEVMLDAVNFAHRHIKELVEIQKELCSQVATEKMSLVPLPDHSELRKRVSELAFERIKTANRTAQKEDRAGMISRVATDTLAALAEAYPDSGKVIKDILHDLERIDMRETVLSEGRRIDGRSTTDIRAINCEIGVLPRTHGSALFTRGQTQSLGVVTLGTKSDEQLIDDMEQEKTYKTYMLHYNFPSYSTGETKPLRGPGRREIGHGYLAERSLEAMIPNKKEGFPYTIRIVSEILESNGSSSMASVCSGSLALMDAGVPMRKPVAGIAMGLIMEGNRTAVLSDILGAEDHLGDMDFKVAGTTEGITGFQLDIKITGLSIDIMKTALEQARLGRLHILDIMRQTIETPRADLSLFAPRIVAIMIDPTKIGAVIGPGGKIIRAIQEETGAVIEIDDDGTVQISSVNAESVRAAVERVQMIVTDPEEGKIYEGRVVSIVDFGAFIEILPGKEGLLHISEIENRRLNRVDEVLSVGEMVKVKLMRLEANGKMSLSRKVLLEGGNAGGGQSERPRREGGDQPRSGGDGGRRFDKPRR